MSKSLQSHNTTQPTVEEVEGIERDAQPADERVVATGHEEQWDHVGDGEGSSAVDEHGRGSADWLGEIDTHNTESDIGGEVAGEEDELKAGRKSSNIDGRAELEFAVMPLAKDR